LPGDLEITMSFAIDGRDIAPRDAAFRNERRVIENLA
jgi:hypothetical protein